MLFRGGYIHDICQEHAFYIQNQTGDLTIENVLADRIGRTFLQTTSRFNEGPPGRGQITVRNVWIRDAALEGNCQTAPVYRGGSALTFTGRHLGPSLVDNAIVQFGFNQGLNQAAGFVIGTAGFVTWLGNGSGNIPNGPIRLQNSKFLRPVRSWYSVIACGTKPIRARTGGPKSMSRPSTVTVPESRRSTPAIMEIVVVLPAPLGPSRP